MTDRVGSKAAWGSAERVVATMPDALDEQVAAAKATVDLDLHFDAIDALNAARHEALAEAKRYKGTPIDKLAVVGKLRAAVDTARAEARAWSRTPPWKTRRDVALDEIDRAAKWAEKAEAERDEALDARVADAIESLTTHGQYSTHYDGCAADHPLCRVRGVLEDLNAARHEALRRHASLSDCGSLDGEPCRGGEVECRACLGQRCDKAEAERDAASRTAQNYIRLWRITNTERDEALRGCADRVDREDFQLLTVALNLERQAHAVTTAQRDEALAERMALEAERDALKVRLDDFLGVAFCSTCAEAFLERVVTDD